MTYERDVNWLMNIQPLGVYTGTYATIRNVNNRSQFPYSVKVDGYGNSKNRNNLFNFAAVTITEHFQTNKYGSGIINGPRIYSKTLGSKKTEEYTEVSKEKVAAVELPESFDKLKNDSRYYYHGKNISDYELIQTAVASGKMELPDNIARGDEASVAHEAFKVLVQDQAQTKNPWSNTLYSEDGKYTFTKDANGKYCMHLIDDESVGASVDDIANWMMSGTPNRNIETRYLNYLRTVDPDLFNAAMQIGNEVRTYGYMEDLYNQGILSEKQNDYDMSLLGMMFGKDSEGMRSILSECRKSGDYLQLLNIYNPDGAASLQNLRAIQVKSNGGVV